MTMIRASFLLTLLSLTAMLSCNSPDTRQADHVALMDTLMADYHEDYLRLNPIEATLTGDTRYNDTLHNDISAAFREQLRAFSQNYKDRLGAIDRNALDEEDRLSYDIIAFNCDLGLERLKFKEHLMPINQFWSLPLMVGQLASGASFQPFATVEDYENWLSRLDDYIEWCDTAIVNMRKGMAEGYVLPKVLAQRVIPQVREFDHGPVADHHFYAPVKKMPETFSAEDRQRLTQAYEEVVSQKIIPVHKRLADFIEKEYLPACRETAGISEIPNGREYYQFLIKYYTTTDMTAEEVFELGKQEVERITREMEAVMKETGFKGNLKAFFDHLRTRQELMPFT